MAQFTPIVRRRGPGADVTPGRELSEAERRALPSGSEAVGEALVSGSDPAAACIELGRMYARDGASLGEALTVLRTTYARCLGQEPAFAAVEALATAWSEATLEFVNQISCEDPLTGLATLPHLRSRLSEIYRETESAGVDARTAHALVIVETRSAAQDPFGRALVMTAVADALRTVFSAGETVGRAGANRALAVVRRSPDLGFSVSLLRDYLADLDLDARQRVWIEGLPASAESAGRLLDELAR